MDALLSDRPCENEISWEALLEVSEGVQAQRYGTAKLHRTVMIQSPCLPHNLNSRRNDKGAPVRWRRTQALLHLPPGCARAGPARQVLCDGRNTTGGLETRPDERIEERGLTLVIRTADLTGFAAIASTLAVAVVRQISAFAGLLPAFLGAGVRHVAHTGTGDADSHAAQRAGSRWARIRSVGDSIMPGHRDLDGTDDFAVQRAIDDRWQGSPPRVLVVDDHAAGADALQLLLEQDGFETLSVADARTAGALAGQRQPPAVVADISMPGMTGLQLARRLGANALTLDTLLVAFTAGSAREDITQVVEAGFGVYCVKPFAPVRLLAILRSLRGQ